MVYHSGVSSLTSALAVSTFDQVAATEWKSLRVVVVRGWVVV